MREIVWGWITAGIGLAIMVLLFLYALESGTWRDEAGALPLPPPSFAIPFAIGGLGVIVFIGGLIMALVASGERATRRR